MAPSSWPLVNVQLMGKRCSPALSQALPSTEAATNDDGADNGQAPGGDVPFTCLRAPARRLDAAAGHAEEMPGQLARRRRESSAARRICAWFERWSNRDSEPLGSRTLPSDR